VGSRIQRYTSYSGIPFTRSNHSFWRWTRCWGRAPFNTLSQSDLFLLFFEKGPKEPHSSLSCILSGMVCKRLSSWNFGISEIRPSLFWRVSFFLSLLVYLAHLSLGFITPNAHSQLDWGTDTSAILKRLVSSAQSSQAGTQIVLTIGKSSLRVIS